MTSLKVAYLPTDSIIRYERNARTHSNKQIRKIAKSIKDFGFTNPILVDRGNRIIAGHGRLAAAKFLSLKEVPTICLADLSDAQRRAYILADNKLALDAGWDFEVLALELDELSELGLGEQSGFEISEIDIVLDRARDSDPIRPAPAAEDEQFAPPSVAVTRQGDLWQLGRHCLLCGDARAVEDYRVVTFDEKIDVIFTDPPYNCKIDGHVSGKGKNKHREFLMASGEMSPTEFTAFLTEALSAAASVCRDGALAYVCMDWRGLGSLLSAGAVAFTEQKQLCVWNKTNGGMGTLYRSKHELIAVYKIGTAPHTNTFGLGETGRYRTNVWDYPGINSTGSARAEDHARHPTPKPVALVADAIRDSTKRGDLVLDPFGGSGSTLIAAEVCGRTARLIELDPIYCDVIIQRYERYTGKKAVLMDRNQTFEEAAAARFGRNGLDQ